MSKTRRVTIKDVAKEAGVTHTTVSRVIHDDARISDGTKARVRKALEALKYQPNLVARGLVRNRSQSIALITPELNPHVLPIVRSVAEYAEAKDYAMMLFPTDTWIEEGRSFAWVAENWLVDGILIYNLIYHEDVPPEVDRLRESEVPFVFINKFTDKSSVNAVGIDNDASVYSAVEHLVQLGHKRIGLLNGDMTSIDAVQRSEGFKKAVRSFGLEYDEDFSGVGNWEDDLIYPEVQRILDHPNPPTAFFSANDKMAIGAMRAIQERGLSVPGDISIVGYDNLDAGRYSNPPLTTIEPPLREVGTMATQLLMQVLQEPSRRPEQIKLDSQLLVRNSTGPCKG